MRRRALPIDEIPDGMLVVGPYFLKSDTQKLCVEIEDFTPNDDDRAWIARELGDVAVVPCNARCEVVLQDDGAWLITGEAPRYDTGD